MGGSNIHFSQHLTPYKSNAFARERQKAQFHTEICTNIYTIFRHAACDVDDAVIICFYFQLFICRGWNEIASFNDIIRSDWLYNV